MLVFEETVVSDTANNEIYSCQIYLWSLQVILDVVILACK